MNNRKRTPGRKIQTIYSERLYKKIGVKKYRSKNGKIIHKNVYALNENAKPLKQIHHDNL